MFNAPSRWPAWKHYLIMACIFILGLLMGRLVLESWPLMLATAAVLLALGLLLYSEKRRPGTKPLPVMKPVKQTARQQGGSK